MKLITTFLLVYIERVFCASYEPKCTHKNSAGTIIGPDQGLAFCEQTTTYIPETYTQHSSCASRACSSWHHYCCRGCRYGGCCGYCRGSCSAYNGHCTSYTYWKTSDNNAYYAYGEPFNWATRKCNTAYQDGDGYKWSNIWSPFPCTNKVWPSGKCQSAGKYAPVGVAKKTWTATYTPECGTCPKGKYSAANPFGKKPAQTMTAPSYDNCKTWKAVSLLQPNYDVNRNECISVPSGYTFKSISIAGKSLCCPPGWTIYGDGSGCSSIPGGGGDFCYLYGNDLESSCPNPCGSVFAATGVTGFECSINRVQTAFVLGSKGIRIDTKLVDSKTFTLPSSSKSPINGAYLVQKSVNGVYRFDGPDSGTSKTQSLYIFDPDPKWGGGNSWMSNTADPTTGTSKVRCRTGTGLAAYSEPLSSSRRKDSLYVIGGTHWTLLKDGGASDVASAYVDKSVMTPNPLPGHPCTAGLFNAAGDPYMLQQMYTCTAIDTSVPGYSTPVRGKQCMKWRHVSHAVDGGTATVDTRVGSEPSPFGLYKVTPRRNKETSDPTMTPALYIYDKLGWEQGCTYCWNTKVRFLILL
jgi:hypothetical protein